MINLSEKNELNGRVALVTGGARGIGLAITKSLVAHGAKVVIADVGSSINGESFDPSVAESAAQEIGNNVIAYTESIADPLTAKASVELAIKKFGALDILVNNAGTNRPENFSKVKTKDMNYVVDLNIKAAFNVAQLATKVMLKTKKRKALGGSIINMSSQLGKVGAPNRSVYNMTKFGIEGLTKGMAIDLAKNNIRVNSICPTFVETPLVKKFFKDKQFKKAMIDNIPLGRLATESDIATAVVYLASNASSMLTGSSLVIDGGWTAK